MVRVRDQVLCFLLVSKMAQSLDRVIVNLVFVLFLFYLYIYFDMLCLAGWLLFSETHFYLISQAGLKLWQSSYVSLLNASGEASHHAPLSLAKLDLNHVFSIIFLGTRVWGFQFCIVEILPLKLFAHSGVQRTASV